MTTYEPSKTRIAWIGTGVMGAPMCGHLMAAGCAATVYNRTRGKAADLLDKGAKWADSPRAAAEGADVVFTIVGFPKDVREVYFGENGVLKGLGKDCTAVDMTTTSPSLSVEIAAAARAQGAWAVDAPVSGGDVGARGAALSIMVGGDDGPVARVMPLLTCMGRDIVHQGGPGAGQHAKMCNQIAIAGNMIGVCESMRYAVRSGLDPETVLSSITKGAAGSWSLQNLAPRMIKGDKAPGFMIDHFLKDMGIALDEARRMELGMPGLSLVEGLYRHASEAGYGRNGTQALYEALDKL
ncbi:MAG: NAD(P)-dependent oxidoreductase [Desulfovibrionaceae bacterium]|jgi:3-hydroxyisobutyrate dehydrogenase|nr:NAD(P)-dependent oxidoreductase [Desulfovibrionaceae bacterium]